MRSRTILAPRFLTRWFSNFGCAEIPYFSYLSFLVHGCIALSGERQVWQVTAVICFCVDSAGARAERSKCWGSSQFGSRLCSSLCFIATTVSRLAFLWYDRTTILATCFITTTTVKCNVYACLKRKLSTFSCSKSFQLFCYLRLLTKTLSKMITDIRRWHSIRKSTPKIYADPETLGIFRNSYSTVALIDPISTLRLEWYNVS